MNKRAKCIIGSIMVLVLLNICINVEYRFVQAQTAEIEIEDYIYSTFFGGINEDLGVDIAVDSKGDIIVVGNTMSHDFPTLNAIQNTHAGGVTDAFFAKFNATGQLLWSTFFGGNGSEYNPFVTLDESDKIIIMGGTSSINFPLTADAYQSTYGGGDFDNFLVKLDSNGSLIYSTYLGGTGYDTPLNIVSDSSGNLIILGGTTSQNFPITTNAEQDVLRGLADTVLTKFNSDFSSMLYSTFLGGSSVDFGQGIFLDGTDILLCGITQSIDFPITTGAFQNTYGGVQDAFFARYNDLGQLTYATYLGGSDLESGLGIAADRSGDIILLGRTNSTNFPVTTNAYQGTYKGVLDIFISKFNSEGQDLIFSTYLGGNDYDMSGNLDIILDDKILITGATESPNFPVIDAFQGTLRGAPDITIALLSQDGELLYSSYLGGMSYEISHNQVYFNNSLYFTGATASPDFLISNNAYQSYYKGNEDAYIFRFDIEAYLIAIGSSVFQKHVTAASFELFVPLMVFFTIFIIKRRRIAQNQSRLS